MIHSVNSLKAGYIGDYTGTAIGVIEGDTRSLDHSSYKLNVGFSSNTEGLFCGNVKS